MSKIISRGFTPRAVERLREELSQRAQNIAKTAADQGSGDFVEQVSCELPLQAIAGLLGVPQEDRLELFRWSNEMTGGTDPEYAHVDPAQSSVELITYAMAMAEERAKNTTDDIVTRRIDLSHGSLTLPSGPGLGVALDERKITQYGFAEATVKRLR